MSGLFCLKSLRWLALLLAVGLVSAQAESERATRVQPLVLHTYLAAIREYNQFLAGRDVYAVDDYRMSADVTRRVILEMVLMKQALHRGGVDRPIRFQAASDDYDTILDLTVSGKVLMHADSFWLNDLTKRAPDLYISDATLADGEYVVGLYTAPSNTEALGAGKNLSNLVGVSNRAWSADWDALRQLELKQLKHVRHWRVMAKMVASGDADFMLNPFQSTSDMSIGRGGYNLVPIPKVKLALYDSRHFAISRNHPLGSVVIKALNRGMAEMKMDGIWQRAFVEAGVCDPRVKDWLLLNPR